MSALSESLASLRSGRMIVLVDDENRENEGDLVVAAQFVTPEAITFMAKHGSGLICLCLTGAQIDRLQLPPMALNNRSNRSTAFTVSIEAKDGISTGISAPDRAHTIRTASNPGARPEDIVSPGHIFPLRAQDKGVLVRDGHTEGAVDLMRLAGLEHSAVICEIMTDSGTMASGSELAEFARHHDLPVLSIREIIEHRLATEVLVEEVSRCQLPTRFSDEPLTLHVFRSLVDDSEYLALVRHPLRDLPLVRVHSECLTGDALGSLRCDCGEQLQGSIRSIAGSESGVLVYLRGHEGHGIGLANKIRAYALQESGLDTVEANTSLGFGADQRNYSVAAHILKTLGLRELTLLSNNPHEIAGLRQYGIAVRDTQRLVAAPNEFNSRYLDAKRDLLGQYLPVAEKPLPQAEPA